MDLENEGSNLREVWSYQDNLQNVKIHAWQSVLFLLHMLEFTFYI